MANQHSIHLGVENTIADLLAHPSLKSFAKHLLPTSQNALCQLKFRDIARILPWHNHVYPPDTLQAINHLIDIIGASGSVFHSFYRAISLKECTGLFHFPGDPGAPFALICSGGGFRYVGTLHEGLPLAHFLSRRGINAFALQYRAAGEKAASQDMAKALSWIFGNAQKLGVSAGSYSVWGASAGGRMAANLGSYGSEALGGMALPQPAALVLAYTIRDWTVANEPPTFAISSDIDRVAPAEIMLERTRALQASGVDAQILIVKGVKHGFGLGTGTRAEGWPEHALKFWLKQIS